MSGAPTEADIGQSRGCISQIGIERAKTSTKNLRGDLIIACGLLGLLNLVYCAMNLRGVILATVEEEDRRFSGTVLGGDADVGDPGAGRKVPEALALNGSGRQARISHGEHGGPREDAHYQGGAGTEQSRAGAPLAERRDPRVASSRPRE